MILDLEEVRARQFRPRATKVARAEKVERIDKIITIRDDVTIAVTKDGNILRWNGRAWIVLVPIKAGRPPKWKNVENRRCPPSQINRF